MERAQPLVGKETVTHPSYGTRVLISLISALNPDSAVLRIQPGKWRRRFIEASLVMRSFIMRHR